MQLLHWCNVLCEACRACSEAIETIIFSNCLNLTLSVMGIIKAEVRPLNDFFLFSF